jgi:hypothetical protein
MKIRRKQPTVTISHPNDPSFRIHVRKLSRIEQFAHHDKIVKHQVAQTLKDEAGNVLRDKDGRPEVHVTQLMPTDLVLEMLADVIVGWDGLLDENDAPIPFSKGDIGLLLDEGLDVKENVTGEDGAVTVKVSPLSQYISEQVNAEKTFDPDPPAAL